MNGERRQIFTVTLNPSLDCFFGLKALREGEVNRAENMYFRPGGKGMNVTQVLQELGHKSVAIGFAGAYVQLFRRKVP